MGVTARAHPLLQPAGLAFAALGVIWGSNFIFMKWAADSVSAGQVTFLRVLFGFLPVLAYAAARRALSWRHARHLHHFVVMSVLATSLYYFAFAAGTALLPSGIAGALSGAIPLFTFACAFVFLRTEQATPVRLLGILVGFGGVLLVARPWESTGEVDPLGVAYMLLGSASVGLSFVYAKRFVTPLGVAPAALTTYQIGLALLTLLVLTDLDGMGRPRRRLPCPRRRGDRPRSAGHRRRLRPLLLPRRGPGRGERLQRDLHPAHGGPGHRLVPGRRAVPGARWRRRRADPLRGRAGAAGSVPRGAPRRRRGSMGGPVTPTRPRLLWPLAVANLVANIGIVVTGGAVRLTGSGLGCPTWPRCTESSYVPHGELGVHGVIEFGNRTLTFLLAAIAIGCWVAALLARRADRGDTLPFRLATVIALGVPAQALIGGVTVLTDLNPWVVSFHLLVSMAIIGVCVWLLDELRGPPRAPSAAGVRRLALGLFAAGWLVLYLGTVVTGSGPHAGDEDSPRNGLDPLLLSQLHADGVFLFLGLMLALTLVTSGAARRAAVTLLLVSLAQGTVGFVQYFSDLPILLVGVHLLGAALVAAAMTWALLATRGRVPDDVDPDMATAA